MFDEKQLEEKEDEFIVKMLIRPMTEGEIEEESGGNNGASKQTLTQLMKKKTSSKSAKTTCKNSKDSDVVVVEDDTDESEEEKDKEEDDDGLNNSISSQEFHNETMKLSASTTKRKNKLVYLCALEDGTKQKVSVLKLLYQIKPKYVVLYDTVLWFVRQLEVFKTIHNELDMRVYFLMYTNSCEEQRYLTSIRCEKESFEILIREKAVSKILK